MDNVLVVIVAVFAGAGASLVTGWLARPKTKADADAANANAHVSVSADAREWAVLWMSKSREAEQKAQMAEEKAAEAAERCDAIETHMDEVTAILVRHIRVLEDIARSAEQPVPPMPEIPRFRD